VANTHSLDEAARQVAGNFGGSLGVPEPVASKRLAAKLPATISERSSAQRQRGSRSFVPWRLESWTFAPLPAGQV
jgi:hypothetical protein